MAQSLVLSIDVYPGLGISPLQTNIWLSFSQADFGPRSAQDFFFGVFEKFETFFSKICAHSERYRNLLAGIFEIPTFSGNIAFPSSPVPHIFRTINSLLYEIRSLCPATSALPHVNVEREAQATRSSAKRDQLRTLLGPLRPTGGIVSKRCCISVVVQQYAQVPDRWIVMRLVQA